MADDTSRASPKHDQPHAEDAETRAARRELKQSTISDIQASTGDATVSSSADSTADRPETPAVDVADAENEELKDQISSPKKKRAHDQLDGEKKDADNDAKSVTSTDSAKDRTSRLEPEKKRHRDGETGGGEETAEPTDKNDNAAQSASTSTRETSASAFAASGFGKLAAGSSPFASLSGGKESAFGAPQPSLSSFASPQASSTQPAASAPKLTFGGGNGASPFAGLSSGTNGFGSGVSSGGAFGAALAGAKPLGSFAAPGSKPLQSSKPAKPFGAPDSDVEDEEGDDDDETDAKSHSDDAERAVSPEKETDEKKRIKLQKVEVDDGEAGEATVVSVRAKMFYHDKEAGWKERGAGMLKINAPESCVEFDENGAIVAGSFDASGLQADDEEAAGGTKGHKVVRLLMRQDQTHRVILNTAILPAMTFQEKTSLKSVGIVFTAFEGAEAKPVSVTMRMSAANAKALLNEISVIQRELQN